MEKWAKGDSRSDASLFPIFLMLESATVPMEKALGTGLSGLMVSFHGKNWIYYERRGEFEKVAKELVKKIEKDPYFVEKAIKKTYESMDQVFRITEEVCGADLGKKTNAELLDYYLEYCKRLKIARGYGWIAPALDMTGFLSSKLEAILGKYLKGREGETPKYFNALTTPDKITTMRKEEMELLELACEAAGKKELEELFRTKREAEIISVLKKNHPQFFNMLSAHHENYTWLPVIFEGEPWKKEYFVSAISGMLKAGEDPKAELGKIEERRKREKEARQMAFSEIPLTAHERNLFEIASEILHFKAERKDLYQKSYFQINPLLVEIGKRTRITLARMRMMLPEEVKGALFDGNANRELLDERGRFCVAISENNSTRVFVGLEARHILDEDVEKENVKTDVSELKGKCANPGFARGIVRQILSPSDLPKMKKGDILVAQATNPDVVPAMRKAAAIVTNTGGITCHAAIVSRELGTPCIVGTKIATDVLKDGMEVEVDATRGIVKILRK
ncbi:MAG: PEP-utilizing enzyme [Candidatus Micrarchaeota archaeon]